MGASSRLRAAAPLPAFVVALAELAASLGATRGHVARAPGATAVLHFGAAVAVAGDELLVGRPDVAARLQTPTSGVHVFRRDATGAWRELAVLGPTPRTAPDAFGAALAVDGSWLAVGAPLAAGERGSVYLFERLASGRWLERAKLVPHASVAGDHFGSVVALADGVLLVGAPERTHEHGAVAVFQRGAANGRWTEEALLTSADSSAFGFGRALALAAGRVIVGAPGPALAKGVSLLGVAAAPAPAVTAQVFVFRDSAEHWVPEARLLSPDTLAAVGASPRGSRASPASRASRASRFGAALLGDPHELWIADPVADGGGTVFRFQPEAVGQWHVLGRLTAPAGMDGEQFGAALAQAGQERLVTNTLRGSGKAGRGLGLTIFVLRYDTTASNWTVVQQLAPGMPPDTGVTGATTVVAPQLAPPPAWFTAAPALAAGENPTGAGIALLGAVWLDTFEGAGLIFARPPATAEPAGLDAGQGRWAPQGTLLDTAWTTRQPLLGRPWPCRAGRVQGVFACHQIELLAFLPKRAIGGAPGEVISNLWGWSDAVTGREFALVGRTHGTAVIEVTDPLHPVYIGVLPPHPGAQPSYWREIKVYRDHAFIVSDGAGAHGVQVLDLTQLRTITKVPVTLQETAHYAGLASAHDLVVDTATGFLYAVGSNGGGETCGGGLHMLDVHEPLRPIFVGCYAEPRTGRAGTGYIHDAECVVYHGPDARYQDHELCFNAAETALSIADVTDKQRPQTLSLATYPDIGYTHQGWLSEDHRYLFVDDEFDEYLAVLRPGATRALPTRTLVFDLRDLTDPVLVTEVYAATTATDHNQYVRGRYLSQSNYTAGLRVLDIQAPRHPREVGRFDTAPAFSDSPGPGEPRMSEGSWGNYPYFRNGMIAVTSMSEGFFLVRLRPRPSR